MKTGIELISTERNRQKEVEGYDQARDLSHNSGELNDAAICYAQAAASQARGESVEYLKGMVVAGEIRWPWEDEWWKPSEAQIRNLVKAGALIAAEIDRLLNVQTLSGRSKEHDWNCASFSRGRCDCDGPEAPQQLVVSTESNVQQWVELVEANNDLLPAGCPNTPLIDCLREFFRQVREGRFRKEIASKCMDLAVEAEGDRDQRICDWIDRFTRGEDSLSFCEEDGGFIVTVNTHRVQNNYAGGNFREAISEAISNNPL